jgi:hemin uptake protein HemP
MDAQNLRVQMRIIIICRQSPEAEPPMRELHTPLPPSSVPLTPSPVLKRLSSEELIGPARELLIRHAGFDYRLRITRQGKLILTK